MRLKNSFFYTFREDAKDEDSISGNLLTKAGMIKKTSAGVYMYLPLGYRVLCRIRDIIRQEMNRTGAQEALMPALISEDVFVASGRRAGFGADMFTLKDRNDKAYALGPTHEEIFAAAAKMKIKSYKDMPFNIYQFQTKYRDEPRPRFGLIRMREFEMKDAYSFDVDLAGLDVSYRKMYEAYRRSFDRLGLNYAVVRADMGVMGGLLSEEFQAYSDIGEDVVVRCDSCDFAANLEVAERKEEEKSAEEERAKELVYTPNEKTIPEVSSFLGLPPSKFVKTMLYDADTKTYAVLAPGDREINEAKLKKVLKATELSLRELTPGEEFNGTYLGFVGPVGLKLPLIVDQSITKMKNFIVGANKIDYHYKNVNLKDFTPDVIADVTTVKEGDKCPKCGGKLIFNKGIEIGNLFKLGTKYSQAFNLQYLDRNGKLQDVVMGSYGIGLGRCMSAIVEQNHDDKGIVWPLEVAPYKVAIVIINTKDEKQVAVANKLYAELLSAGVEPLLDDRVERAGVKFNDLDLIGIPFRVTVGKKVSDNLVEIKKRNEENATDVAVDRVVEVIQEAIK